MKKIISLFIALCIALSLSVPVFAATSDSPITISSEDVITHSTSIPAPTITLRKSAPQVTALELYDYGWIEGTDHWGVIIKVTGYGNDNRKAFWNDTQLTSNDKTLHGYWLGPDNKTAVAFAYLYDCGPITEPGTYTFKTTYVSTNWPYTEKSISLDFTFEATDNT